jgi:hypothetical protein
VLQPFTPDRTTVYTVVLYEVHGCTSRLYTLSKYYLFFTISFFLGFFRFSFFLFYIGSYLALFLFFTLLLCLVFLFFFLRFTFFTISFSLLFTFLRRILDDPKIFTILFLLVLSFLYRLVSCVVPLLCVVDLPFPFLLFLSEVFLVPSVA